MKPIIIEGFFGIEGWGGLTDKESKGIDGGPKDIDGGTVLYIPIGKYVI